MIVQMAWLVSNKSLIWIVAGLLLYACQAEQKRQVILEESISWTSNEPMLLSSYGLFEGEMKDLIPAEGVFPYMVNSQLFSDYAYKARFIYLPEGTNMTYHSEESFGFPEGAMIIKNFYYPEDMRLKEGARKIIETRLLIKTENTEGDAWKALTYVWDEDQQEARLEIAGSTQEVSWIDKNGFQKQVSYLVPNLNQCKTCHEYKGKLVPIGTTARQLHRSMQSSQLLEWEAEGRLLGLADIANLRSLVSWEDAHEKIPDRAMAYLESNCGHCHRPEGSAKNAALHLVSKEKNPAAWGIGKTPIAAGRGSGGLRYDIVPGKPESSIMIYRMKSEEPGIMMPEIGRRLVHSEGLSLIEQWIREME